MDRQEEELINRARLGDRSAFGEIVLRYQRQVLNTAYGILGRREEAEDVAQEAFLKAYLALPGLREPVTFPAWLSRIVVNLCRDRLRRKTLPTVPLEEAEVSRPLHLAATGSLPEEVYVQRERDRAVLAALQKLPSDKRTVLILREVQGFSYQEIAEILHIPVGTVKSRINYARLAFREVWAALNRPEGRDG